MIAEIRLVADEIAAEGNIEITPHFDSMNSLWQIDVLQDWIADLTNEYNKRLDTWRGELRSSLKSD